MRKVLWLAVHTARNRRRYYSLSLTTNLWGNLVAVRRWGRVGTRGREIHHRLDNVRQFRELAERIDHVRIRHGYLRFRLD